MKELKTKHGNITFPTFMPVTTFGDKYPLDRLAQPYLRRMSQCLMVSHYYAQQMKNRPSMPLFIDSGGFAGLFEGASIIEKEGYACIRTKDDEVLEPKDVLHFQEQHADLGATLDFIIPPGTNIGECRRRQELTIQNALYAQANNLDCDLFLFASLQCWDVASARYCARIYAGHGFKGIAIGGMAPRSRDKAYIIDIVRAVREEAPDCILHVFGCGNPELLPELVAAGADSFDSSSYIRNVQTVKNSIGMHTKLYSVIKNLYSINEVLTNGKKQLIDEQIPNFRLCFPESEKHRSAYGT